MKPPQNLSQIFWNSALCAVHKNMLLLHVCALINDKILWKEQAVFPHQRLQGAAIIFILALTRTSESSRDCSTGLSQKAAVKVEHGLDWYRCAWQLAVHSCARWHFSENSSFCYFSNTGSGLKLQSFTKLVNHFNTWISPYLSDTSLLQLEWMKLQFKVGLACNFSWNGFWMRYIAKTLTL